MKWDEIGRQSCSVARALSVVGDRWTLLVLRECFLGTRRFGDFQANTGAARNLLADRLQKLVGNGVLERHRYEDKPPRDEYRLTEKGLELHPVLVSLAVWGDRWMDDGDGPPVEIVHKDCDAVTKPHLACSECGAPVRAHDLRTQPGPGFRPHGRPSAVSRRPSDLGRPS
jgi:DNA-binding HxlR family transcriptional regulator